MGKMTKIPLTLKSLERETVTKSSPAVASPVPSVRPPHLPCPATRALGGSSKTAREAHFSREKVAVNGANFAPRNELSNTLLTVEIPMALPSVANLREHWATKAKRVKKQRDVVKLALKILRPHGLVIGHVVEAIAAATRGEQLIVTLTRIGRKLDSDNLASAFKAVRDQVAAELGIDDGSDAIGWHYVQAKGPAGIRIEVSAVVP